MNEFVFFGDARHAIDAARPGTTLFALALWIRLGFVGTSVPFVALVSLFDAETNAPVALAVAVAGGVLAAVAWQRVRKALREEDDRDAKNAPRVAVNS